VLQAKSQKIQDNPDYMETAQDQASSPREERTKASQHPLASYVFPRSK